MLKGIIWLSLQLTAFTLCQTYTAGAAPTSYYHWLLIHICMHVSTMHQPEYMAHLTLTIKSIKCKWKPIHCKDLPWAPNNFQQKCMLLLNPNVMTQPIDLRQHTNNTPAYQGPTKQIPAHPNSHDPQIFPLAILTIIFPTVNFNAIPASCQSAMSMLSTRFFHHL
jgi:hypothetical protein